MVFLLILFLTSSLSEKLLPSDSLEIRSTAVLPLIVEKQYINMIFTKGDRICIEYCHAYNDNKKKSAQQETCVVMQIVDHTL